jgi:ribosomal protein S18 acetylase RimI-like enzyme
MSLNIRTATDADIPTLSRIGHQTFVETFLDGFRIPYSQSDLASFLPAAYGEDAIAGYQANPEYQHFVAESDGEPIGYALVGPNGLPHEDARPEDGELKRIYLLKSAQGLGAGKALYDASINWLERNGPRRIWLGVWSGNEKAQGFYARNGFAKVGEYKFVVGDTLDHEFIMLRA